MAKRRAIEQNNSLLNVISPVGIKFYSNDFVLGENEGKAYSVFKYPSDPEYGWLKRFTNAPAIMVGFTFTPNSGDIITNINKNISTLKREKDEAKDELTKQRADEGIKSGLKLMKQIDSNNEAVGELTTMIVPIARNKQDMIKMEKKTRGIAALSNCKIRPMTFMQKKALQQLAPFYPQNNEILEISNRVMPLRTFVGGFPFSSSGIQDEKGFYVAKDNDGGLVILDFWKRKNDRTNSNFIFLGVPGVGKSAAAKSILVDEFAAGTKLIFIDPESEVKDFCRETNGKWLNAGGSPNARVNPLHIIPIPKNEDPDSSEDSIENYYDRDEGNGLGDLALYLKHLEVFFSLYIKDMNTRHKAKLKKVLIELYHKFGIDWETDASSLTPVDFPILSDLYKLLKEKAENPEKERDREIYEDLVDFIEDAAVGADSFLWNGPTTLESDNQVTVIDTSQLQSTSENVKRSQYFLLETWAWGIMSKDRTEKVMLVCDEAYLMIDPDVPQSMVFLRNVSKRDRKYEAGLMIISHFIVDFLDPKIKMYGQSLLDTPSYKFLFGTDGENLKETKVLYGLTEKEEELLASKKRGHALMLCGSKRMHVRFDIPDYKWKYIGKRGGR